MLKVKTNVVDSLYMRENRMRNLSSIIGGLSLILCFLPLFFTPEVKFFYVPVLKSIFLLFAVIVAILLTRSKDKTNRKYLIPLTITLILLFVSEVLSHFLLLDSISEILSDHNFAILDMTIIIFSVVGLLPLYIRLITQIRPAEKHVSRNVKLISLLITVLALLILSPAITKFSQVFIQEGQYAQFIFTLAVIIIDIDILAISAIFVYLQWKIRKPYFWLLIAGGWIFKLAGDATKSYLIADNTYEIGKISDYLHCVGYAIFLIGLITIFEKYEKPISVKELDIERRQYQSLYEDMNVFAKDLVTVTSLLRHDLLNDLVVIQSGIDLFLETGKKDYLDRVVRRTNTVAERLDSLKSESMLLGSLAIQPIDLSPIYNVTESFTNIEIISLPKDVKVNANRLLYPIVFNVIQNAFQHGGEGVKVEIETIQENGKIMVKIKDNGKGISNEEKELIFQQGYRGSDKGLSGMGLYLVKIVLQSYGGSITVEDNIPKGSVFTINLTKAKN